MSTSFENASPTVLLIDDDGELASLLALTLAREGLVLRHARSAAAGLSVVAGVAGVVPSSAMATPAAHAAPALPSLVLLDLMLPDLPGIELFRRLRERAPRLPVIMLTAKGDPVDRVVGLEMGADDYVAKPFDPRELVARIRAVLRRTLPSPAVGTADARPLKQTFGPAVLDMASRTLSVSGVEVALTAIEFKLLVEFARQPGVPLSRAALTEAVQSHNYKPLERAVDVQVARLRRKLRAIDASAPWVLTARGEGYVWSPPDAAATQR